MDVSSQRRPGCALHAVGKPSVTPVCVLQEFRDKGTEVWKISKVQFVYDTSETSHFINAYNRESPAEPAYSDHSAHSHPAPLWNYSLIHAWI